MEQIKSLYNSFNKSMLSGAIDVIVVEQPDGNLKSTTWHVAFSLAAVLIPNREVDFKINGVPVRIKMIIDDNGIAKFIKEYTEVPLYAGSSTSNSSAINFVLKTQRLDNDQLKGLNLKHGRNEATFSVTTAFQGTTIVNCDVYLFKWLDKLVVSDVDGTISKTDLGGHVLGAVGVDWEHSGVAELYSGISMNGYQIFYLSSRPIGQAAITKNYLKRVIQGAYKLPDGPVLVSPSSIVGAVKRELSGNPDTFKIPCLSDVKELFPVTQPFYAGFGNRETDVRSYRAVGIPESRIYVVDTYGKVSRADSIGFITRYDWLAADLDAIFPPLMRKLCRSKLRPDEKIEKLLPEFTKAEKFSSYTYWRTTPYEVSPIDEDELANYEFQRKLLLGKSVKRRAISF